MRSMIARTSPKASQERTRPTSHLGGVQGMVYCVSEVGRGVAVVVAAESVDTAVSVLKAMVVDE